MITKPKTDYNQTIADRVEIMAKIDYSQITKNKEVIELLEKRKEIEQQIINIDEMALINYELALI